MRLVGSVRREHLGFLLVMGILIQLMLTTHAPVSASGTPAFVQQSSATTTTLIAPTISATFPSAVTTGDTIVVAVAGDSPSGILATSITDTAGNTYVKAIDFPLSPAANTSALGIWYAANATGGAGLRVTGGFSQSGTLAIAIQEYSGLGPAVTAFQAVGASGDSGLATTCTPVQTSQSGELLVAAMTIDTQSAINTLSPGSGYSLRAQQLASDTAHQAIATEDQGAGTILPPGSYPASFNFSVASTSFPAWHLVAVGLGATGSPTTTPPPTGTPIPQCFPAPKSQLYLPLVGNTAGVTNVSRVGLARP